MRQYFCSGWWKLVLRICGVGYPTDVTVPCTVQGRPASCYNLFFAAPFFPPGMIKTPQMYAIPAEKPPGTVRIVVLGESAAMGDPEPAFGFSRYLEVMLGERYPSMKFEIVNTGSVAINSHVVLPIAKGLAKFRPDVFIIYSGNNEVVGPYGPGTALTSAGMSLPVIRSSIFYHSTRIGQLLTKVGTPEEGMGRDGDVSGQAGSSQFAAHEVCLRQLRTKPARHHRCGSRRRRQSDRLDRSHKSDGLRSIRISAPGRISGPDALRSWSTLVQQGAEQENAGSYAEALKSVSRRSPH